MQFRFGDTVIHPAEPTQCPDCRMLIRVCNRNENNLYRNTSAKSQKPIISIYAKEPLWGDPYKVYTQEEWNADSFDATVYAREFNFSRPFFEQFSELSKAVPHMAVVTVSNENCDYTTGTGYCKNCYLINSSEYCEDCYYGKLYQKCTDVMDSAYMYDCELCYDCFSLHGCTRCTSVSFSKNSHDCLFSSYLQGCKNCCLCTNLTQKEYYFQNKPLSKEEYEKRVNEIRGSHSMFQAMKNEMRAMLQQKIWKYGNIINSQDCTGDYIENSRNCRDCYDTNESEDCRYVQVGVNVKDLQHCSNMYLKPELCYETLGTIEAYNCAYCLYVFHSQNMLYSEHCYTCHDCFGCSGLRRKQFCIFNKQYTKEEYEVLVPKIIEHMKTDQRSEALNPSPEASGSWGRFFPPHLSAFGYNESVAQEYAPLMKEEAVKRGFLWRDLKDDAPQVSKTLQASDLPDSIDDCADAITDQAVSCTKTGRPFRILKKELEFYKAQGIPLPRLHPAVRYEERMRVRNPRKLWNRECAKCQKPIETTFAPERAEVVLCEECYLKEVY